MDEYIKREKLAAALSACETQMNRLGILVCQFIKSTINAIPAADVRPERYAKKVKFFNDPWTGRMFTTCTACDGKVGQHDKFCKHCGAKFEVGE